MKTLIIDELCNEYICKHPNATIIHLGCGLDSRSLRVNQNFKTWYDVDYENVAPKTKYITPVPGGVGPMTVAMLGKNILKAYKIQKDMK